MNTNHLLVLDNPMKILVDNVKEIIQPIEPLQHPPAFLFDKELEHEAQVEDVKEEVELEEESIGEEDIGEEQVGGEEVQEEEEVEEEEIALRPKLVIDGLHYCWRNNGRKHKTTRYHLWTRQRKKLVVRRGRWFKLMVKANREFDPEDNLSVSFKFCGCDRSDYGNGTKAITPLILLKELDKTEYEKTQWWVKTKNTVEFSDSIIVEILPPQNCIIGKWRLCIYSNADPIFVSQHKFYVIFNAWDKGDDCYLEDPSERIEYVSRDIGGIVIGTPTQPRIEKWKFSQFDKNILDCVLCMIYKVAKLPYLECSSAVSVVKALTSCIVQPELKKEKIISQCPKVSVNPSCKSLILGYLKDKEAVASTDLFTQVCLLVTAFRTLGIPSRIVTGFNIPNRRDNNGSTVFNRYFVYPDGGVNEINEELWYLKPWVEVYSQRQELRDYYSGWQYVGEEGPVPVVAIKNQEFNKPHGCVYAFNSVHSHYIRWEKRTDDWNMNVKLVDCNGIKLGKPIYTKAIKSFLAEDITDNYKSTRDYLPNIYKTLKMHNFAGNYYINPDFTDVDFELELCGKCILGLPIRFEYKITNKSSTKKYTIETFFRLESIFINGKSCHEIFCQENQYILKRNRTEVAPFEISFDLYKKRTEVDYGYFRVLMITNVILVGYTHIIEKTFTLQQPELQIIVSLNSPPYNRNLLRIDLLNKFGLDIDSGVFIIQEIDTKNRVAVKFEGISTREQFSFKVHLESRLKKGIYFIVAKLMTNNFHCKKFVRLKVD